jgi:RNA ligase (TIGR02306 family)
MRKMATIRKIDALRPIVGADAIECAVVGGWTCVVKKGEFNVGDLAVYLEIDSWVPTELAPFLSKGKEPREFEGIKGERLRTVKLRGQLSQGLLLPLEPTCANIASELIEGLDVSLPLNIQKWEQPMNAQLAGMAKGNFPSLIPKTDQERVQNLKSEIAQAAEDRLEFEVTEKLEGSSMTVYLIDGVFGVCSRNLDLRETEDNTFWQVARRDDIEAKMRAFPDGVDFAIQGELIGPGIQGNIYKLSKPEFRVFDVYSISGGYYLSPSNRREFINAMGLLHVPVMLIDKDLGVGSIEEILQWADAKSVMGDITGPWREGIVFKQVDGGMTFKAISNKYLLKSIE